MIKIRKTQPTDITILMDIFEQAKVPIISSVSSVHTYTHIYEGKWVEDTLPYCVIHRLASTEHSKGVANACRNI